MTSFSFALAGRLVRRRNRIILRGMSFADIIDSLVFFGGLFIWVLFLPQILLLLREKHARTNSLLLTGGSLALQLLLLAQALLRENWPSAFVMGMSVLGNAIIVVLILYYRRFPGGEK
jgi:hypothetical protein